ncbi:hypothetical protein F5Y09DRAFT_350372 [Xylaria sp. FL1042]|nr:hypothetical protein F5Y09DRAFT_350372 [Xylaria sp. FL1042]
MLKNPAYAMLASSATATAREPHVAATSPDNISEKLSNMAIQEPACLVTLPPEVLLGILGQLTRKRDWFALARTCRGISRVAAAELDKSSMNEERDYVFWYACVANKPVMLLRHIAHDATVVNRQFRGSYVRERLISQSDWLMTPLSVAIIAGRDGIVQQLLDNGADANLPDKSVTWSNHHVPGYPMIWAVSSRHKSSVAIIKMLTDHSADVNQVPEPWIKELKRRGHRYPGIELSVPIYHILQLSKPLRRYMHSTRPTSCEQYNHDFKKILDLRLRQLKALLQAGANPNAPHKWEAMSPIFFLLDRVAFYEPSFYFSDKLMLSHEEENQASMFNDIVILFLDTLRDFGADVRALGNTFFYRKRMGHSFSPIYRETPLHAACRLKDRHKLLIYWFLRNGAHIDDLGGDKNTPLMAYCESRFKSIDQFQEFLSYSPDINRRDNLGRTALHYLCANRWLQPLVMENAVRMMLGAGADPTAVSNKGLQPVQEVDLMDGLYDVVLEMIHDASVEWKQLNEEREPPIHSPDRANLWCGDRRGDQEQDHGGRVTSKKENRDDDPKDESPGHQHGTSTSILGGHRGNRDSGRGLIQANNHRNNSEGISHNGNRENNQGAPQANHHQVAQESSGNFNGNHVKGRQNFNPK